MIRVTSEAICETAGSMMNQHCGKNRFLQPENFNIEMYLQFNLGPLHLLDNVFQHRFGKILLDKIYKCVLFENFNKLICY